MKVLITGGAGFIGSALCRLLIRETDWQITNLDKLTYAATLTSLAEVESSPRYRLVKGDINDALLVRDLFSRDQFNAVIHLAAESHVDRSISHAQPFLTTNVLGTFNLLQAALEYWDRLSGENKDAFRFIHVSTDEVFGTLGQNGRFDEASRYDPRSPYSATKASADHLASAWRQTYGLPVIISNCSNNYGPYQFPEKLIPLAILSAMEGRPIPVYGDGSQVRDWLHVGDHAAALKLLLERGAPGRSYLIGGEAERTNLTVVETICDLVRDRMPRSPGRSLITFVEDRPGHDERYAIDPSRIKQELGWSRSRNFEAGLSQTIDWYATRSDWWRPLRTRYSGERLGLRAPPS